MPNERIKKVRYRKLLASVVAKTAENCTLSDQVEILREFGFTDADLAEFGYSKRNIAGIEDTLKNGLSGGVIR